MTAENTTNVAGIPPLPDTALTRRALALVRDTESTPTANHSVRSALFARLRADHQGAEAGRDYDPELLFLACVLHDIGLTRAGDRHQRFEVDGADTAAEFLTEQGLPAAGVDMVWEAIAFHTAAGIAERRGTLCALVHQGTGMDFGWDTDCVDDATGAAIHAAYPRLSMATTLTDEIVAQVRRRPEKAPPFSLPFELLRERSVPPHRTRMETMADAARWGN
ncbi:HD domain-containing protein [Streptomyces alfalfae]|uniref:HD domain-containing protein n=1 Tax=Streptomyces alfalfae TaxID=1642299 RepID=A0A7T4U1P3_9ACTN|nr:HD domain-containing protein [Streptomyces alfalfae]QQC93078.1 HD domain-containing protein [Streptomyces alfalfae]